MKTGMLVVCAVLACGLTAGAGPVRVAIMDFDNQATATAEDVAGGIGPKNLADKGAYILGKALANDPDFTAIDRRDFISQIQAIRLRDGDKPVSVKPSFLRAAQAVNADVVVRGSLVSYSPGKQAVKTEGGKADFLNLTLRVALEALDTRDGSVMAMADGTARQEFRQTAVVTTTLSEDELLQLMQLAVEKAMPDLKKALTARLAKDKERSVVKLSVKSSADPALVELDGVLIGTTPLVAFETYAGDHVLTVGKAGYRDVNKQILFKADTAIEVPLIRTELSADEMKEVLLKARLNIVSGIPDAAIIIDTTAGDAK